MPYLVKLQPRAVQDLDEIFLYIRAESSLAAYKWFNGLNEAMETLEHEPQRSPRTKENPDFYHLLYGNKPHIYRVIYAIDRVAQRVDVLHIRHRARAVDDFPFIE